MMYLKCLPARFSAPKLFTIHLIWVAVVLFCLSCEKDDPMVVSPEPNLDLAAERQKMAVLVADHFIKPAYQNLCQDVEDLVGAAETFVSDPSEENLENFRIRLKETWLTWQDAAIYQLGPTENNALRAAINLYPSDLEKIENNISSGNYTFGSVGNKGAEGLPALDYLINAGTSQEVLSRFVEPERSMYTLTIVTKLQESVATVRDQWIEGRFLQDFTSDGSKGTDVGSAVSLLTNAIDLHFQRFLRDGKVAIPAGVRSAGVPRPKTVESLFGGYSRELLMRGIESYQKLFDGIGIDDQRGTSFYRYLELLDQADIAADMKVRFDDAQAKAGNLVNSFSEQIDTDNDALVKVFLSLQEIVTLIKSDMASVMGITITNQDNDGD